jgi:hypothetical protein
MQCILQSLLKKLRGNVFLSLRRHPDSAAMGEIERTMTDLIAYPAVQEWWQTRKHWHTHEFARVVDEIIARGHQPKAYATCDLREISAPGEKEPR